MEDLEIITRLRKQGPSGFAAAVCSYSARRHEQIGLVRSVFLYVVSADALSFRRFHQHNCE